MVFLFYIVVILFVTLLQLLFLEISFYIRFSDDMGFLRKWKRENTKNLDWTDTVLILFSFVTLITLILFSFKYVGTVNRVPLFIAVCFIVLTIIMFISRSKKGKQPLYVLIIPLFLVLGLYFKNFHGNLSHISSDWSNFGNFFQGMTGPLLGFITVILMIKQITKFSEQIENAKDDAKEDSEYRKNYQQIKEKELKIREVEIEMKALEKKPDFIFEKPIKTENNYKYLTARNHGYRCDVLSYVTNAKDNKLYEEIPLNMFVEKDKTIEITFEIIKKQEKVEVEIIFEDIYENKGFQKFHFFHINDSIRPISSGYYTKMD
jgi:hypothetical protein